MAERVVVNTGPLIALARARPSPQGPGGGPLIIPVDQEGGTLVVDGVGKLADYGERRAAPTVFGRYPLPLPLAYAWAHLNGAAA